MKTITSKAIRFRVFGWISVIFLNVLVLSTFIPVDSSNRYLGLGASNIPIWVLYIILFGVNFYIFIPKFLLRGKYLLYALIILLIAGSVSISVSFYKMALYRDVLEVSIIKESQRTDITVYRKSRNIREIELQIIDSYSNRFYSPFNVLNLTSTYGMVIVIILGIVVALIKKWQNREAIVNEIRQQKIESELAYLKQQINPHFLFNSLNSIYSLILPHSEKASDVVLKLSAILRYMLYETDRDRVILSQELSIMSDYIELQKLKCLDTSGITYDFIGDFDNYYIEPLIFIPFIENAFKYGANSSDKSEINIVVKCANEKLHFFVKNVILNNNKIKGHNGIGVKNISRRLDIIYGNEYLMDIKNENNIFTVNIVISVKENRDEEQRVLLGNLN